MKITLDQVVLKITVEHILLILIGVISTNLGVQLGLLPPYHPFVWTNFFIQLGFIMALQIFISKVIFRCCRESNYEKNSEKCTMREEEMRRPKVFEAAPTVFVVHVEDQEYYPI